MKKTVLFLLAFILLLSFTACGNKNQEKPTNPSAENQSTPMNSDENNQTSPETQNGSIQGNPGTLGETMRNVFFENSDGSVQEIADAAIGNDAIKFMGSTAPVEAGSLAGFKAEITGFDEAVMFAPNISSIPFIGYVFKVSENPDAFAKKLSENADPRWNICTEAEETIVETKDDKVFFVMCPREISE
ncbi:MAG: hypothetical protein E7473_06910 [Ruminococcaceae bacterium]|nr:hypothetical protein [Oscillospiraceae bacterium]